MQVCAFTLVCAFTAWLPVRRDWSGHEHDHRSIDTGKSVRSAARREHGCAVHSKSDSTWAANVARYANMLLHCLREPGRGYKRYDPALPKILCWELMCCALRGASILACCSISPAAGSCFKSLALAAATCTVDAATFVDVHDGRH